MGQRTTPITETMCHEKLFPITQAHKSSGSVGETMGQQKVATTDVIILLYYACYKTFSHAAR